MIFAADGNVYSPALWDLSADALTGPIFASYELLKQLGFVFLHPLEPLSPPSLVFPPALNITSTPRWPIRGTHYHTEHPLELTEVLNGFDSTDGTAWAGMLPQLELFLEWLVANGKKFTPFEAYINMES